jgi:hypothetical protein
MTSWYWGGLPVPASAEALSSSQLGWSFVAGPRTQTLPAHSPSPWHGDASAQT